MTRTPFRRVPDAVAAVLLAAAVIGALVLVPPSQPTAVAAPAVAARADDLLARMSLDDKVGQMTQAERGALNPVSDLATYHIGSVLSGGGSAPEPNTPTAWADRAEITVANRGSTPLSGWTVGWSRPADQSIGSPWNGTLTQTATSTSVDDLDRNGSVGPGRHHLRLVRKR